MGSNKKIKEMITHWSQTLQNFTRTRDDQRHNETFMRDTRYHKILWEATINQRNDHALILDITKSYKNTWWPTTQRNLNAWYHFSRKSMGSNKKSKKWSRTDLRYYKILQEQMMINDTTNISCVLSDIIDIYGKHQKIREMIMHWSQILQNSTRTNDDQRHNETIMRDIRYHRNLWEATNNQRNDHALISDITFFYKRNDHALISDITKSYKNKL